MPSDILQNTLSIVIFIWPYSTKNNIVWGRGVGAAFPLGRGKGAVIACVFAYVIHVHKYCNMNLCSNMWNQCRSIVILFSAFTFLFAIMEPVPWQLKIAFHFFGFGSLILGMVLFASTFASELCVSVFFLLFFMGTLELKSTVWLPITQTF